MNQRGGAGPRTTAAGFDAARTAILATVRRIPKGCVASYSQVAFAAGWPGRARLVGRVLGDVPPELGPVPWFRVINAAGRISLPLGTAAHEKQRKRLEAEGVAFINGRVSFKHYGWVPDETSPLLD